MKTGIYKHHKDGFYQVLGVARHSETNERMVVYIALSGIHMPGPRMCVRPEAMFCEKVSKLIGSTVCEVPRFEYIGDELPDNELARVQGGKP